MKAWREVSIPHPDVLEGTFQQSEFAADITAVRSGRATREYGDAAAFFERTFITEGMGLLLTQVAQRLNGKGGEPVIQLQTAFGGGKTHTMLAVYHMAARGCAISELAGVPPLLDRAGLMDLPKANVAVIDGTAHAPGQPWSHGKVKVRTLWGELGWQLGGEEGLAMLREADESGTSPGKEALRELLERYAPCAILIDELVAYVRQFANGKALSGGTYDSNLSFVQALTEATKLVPTAIVLASLPESEVEAGSSRGVAALKALEKTFGRVQALWKPVGTEEAFEIVRRRLFEPLRDTNARDQVCRAFHKAYEEEGAKLPSETHESRYFTRLVQAYPIHPEIFDRLYEDWTTLEGFQRTRGVLKFMAHVIHRLWKDDNKDLMILPGSLPLYDSNSRNELLGYLPPGWDAVVERDIDGERSETSDIDQREVRFGSIHAARRVARTLFLGSAPSSGGAQKATRGVDRGRVLLGCMQPGQPAATFSDALNRLTDRLHYLNSSGDKAQDATSYWFDTRANLRREMEDRKGRFDDKTEVRGKIAEALKKLASGSVLFDGVHVFTPHGDIPDDSALRLVFLTPDKGYNKQGEEAAFDEVISTVQNNGTKPRYKANRLVFAAADQASLGRLRDSARTALAWASIVEDIEGGRLNIDRLQEEQAKKALAVAEQVVPRAARECYKWLLCPVVAAATERITTVEVFALNTGGAAYIAELERVCADNELVISKWSPIHLRNKLRELYWKDDAPAVRATTVWEDMQRYLYLPRLRQQSVLEQAIVTGTASRDFFGIAYGDAAGDYSGFQLGGGTAQFDDTLLLIEPAAALAYEARKAEATTSTSGKESGAYGQGEQGKQNLKLSDSNRPPKRSTTPPPRAKSFHGSIDVTPATAKMKLVQIADEIVELINGDPTATVRVTVEISADFPNGASEQTRRAVSENADMLGFKSKHWESM